MAQTTVKLLIDSNKNSLTFSKNFRIFSTQDPVTGITAFTEFLEDLIYQAPLSSSNVTRHFRYSRNKLDWSLWYEVSPGNLGDASSIYLDKKDQYFFEVKYEYDDGSFVELPSSMQINEIKLRFQQGSTTPNTFTPSTACSDEKCTSIIANRDPSFRPYNVDTAVGMYNDLSYFTTQIYGHQVVYFRTLPESDSGDFIFKEWTLYKNVDRQCIKVAVPKNAFPSNMPKYGEFGIDFQLPFEVHIDHRYFQSMFGYGSEPRKRDFLYFPLLNRMFEIQGSYLHRGFMMSPTFWKVQLKKYSPNIDMLLKDETRQFLDNVILSGEQLFSEQVENDIKDATLPQQYSTISANFDSSRRAIHSDVTLKPIKYTFNFATLMDNYYDFSKIPSADYSYIISNDAPPISTSMNVENLPSLNDKIVQHNNVVLAYQGSEAYTAWKNGALATNDRNYKSTSNLFVRVRGPFDTIPNNVGQSESGRYIRLEGYRDLTYKTQQNILIDTVSGTDYARFKVKENAVMYNSQPKFNTTDLQNLSYTALFSILDQNSSVQFLNGFDNENQTGIKISGQFIKYFTAQPEGDLNLEVQINSQIKQYTISNISSSKWYAIVVSISNEFKQMGLYIYEITEDPSDIINHNDFKQVSSNISSIQVAEFSNESYYYLPSSDILITNIRLFKTMIKEEQHNFILSQQFIKDESMLIFIDNCRPQLNIPYIAKNR